jgi:hypothetical protein
MPDDSTALAHLMLSRLQNGPPQRPPELKERLENIRTRIKEARHKLAQRRRSRSVPESLKHSSVSSLDGDTDIYETVHHHAAHQLKVIERIHLDGQRLIYKHEVTGPGDKRDERQITFELT